MSDPRHGRGCDCRRCQNRRTRQRTYAATRQHLRYSPPHINPTNIRTYGEPWDSIIAAGAKHTVLQRKTAVDFIVDTVKANPGEITILAIGPLTNIALAVKQNPEIVPLIKKIIYMGGAIDVPGNTTKAAEFNWWFDPDAAQFVVRLPIPQVIVPLDVTDTVFLTKTIYDRIAHPAKPTAVTDVFQKLNGYGFDGKNGFENNPNYTQNIWDTLTLAYLIDPGYATQTVDRYVDVIAKPGAADNGRSIGYASQPAGPTLQKMTVVKKFDNARFFELYVDLLTRPVPVVLPAVAN